MRNTLQHFHVGIFLALVLLVCACQRPTEDPRTGELRGLLGQIPAGAKVFLDPALNALLPDGVAPVAVPALLRGQPDIAPGVALTTVRIPYPPAIYADEVDYLLLPTQSIQALLGCAALTWDPVGRSVGPGTSSYTLWRRMPSPAFADAGTLRPSALVTIPGGTGVVGGIEGQPKRRVEFETFSLEKTEVTYGQYAAFLNALRPPANELAQLTDLGRPENPLQRTADGGYRVPADCADHPMAFVSFAGAQAYCEHLDRHLPTSDQWEVAARGAGTRTYPWGEDDRVSRFANIAGMADGFLVSSPVGSFPQGKSVHGLLDMAGNAYEWTTRDNDVALRGGAWATGPEWARGAAPETNVPHARNNHNGFRCLRAGEAP